MPGTLPDTALDAVHGARVRRERAEIDQLLAVLDWTVEHTVTDVGEAALVSYEEGAPAIAGEGAPLVAEFALVELAAALGMTTQGGMNYVGRALELKHRLPKLFARVIAGELPFWRAAKIADQTKSLPVAGAGFVDRALAPFAHKLTWAQQDRTLAEALLRFDPDEAAAQAARAAEHREVKITPDGGFAYITAMLDLPDALDLDDALRAVATQLREAGCEETLDVRRAMALGEIARGQLALKLGAGGGVTIYAHLSADAVTGTVDNTRQSVLVDEIAGWCSSAAKVTIKPVIDLNQPATTDSYAVPARIREHIALRDKTCVFPYCDHPAQTCDDDHIVPWPRGSTTTTNLAPLCRRHHRAKTHGRFTYTALDPGTYHWTTPSGMKYLRDRHGTTPA